MKAKSLKEWIEIYETKTGDSFDLLPGYRLLYMPERGFIQDDDYLPSVRRRQILA